MKIGNWWGRPGQKYDEIKALTENLQARGEARKQRDLQYCKMYSNRNIAGTSSYNYYKVDPRREYEDDRMRLNVVAAVIDALNSKLAVEQPRVVTLTNGAEFPVRAKARYLQKFIDGILEASGATEQALLAFRDAEIVGTGVLRVFDEWGNIKCERVPKSEILIDDEEAFYGHPTQLHQIKVVSRDRLLEMFPKKRKAIEQATRIEAEFASDYDVSDLVEVRESWHLPSSPEASDGRHVISIDTADLVDEPYKKSCFPFVFIHWKAPVYGFWGTGIVEELRPLQIEINRLLMGAQKAMIAASNPMVFIPAGSSISKMHISEKIGAIIPYVGQPPIIRTHQTVHPEVFQQIENLYRKCFEIIGISQTSATGKKQPGVNAAVAMRELQHIESERFSTVLRQYHGAFVELAEKMIDLARDLYAEQEADTRVYVKSRGFLNQVNWGDIDLREDQFVLDLDTANKLPLTRAGRISTITEWQQAGIISADEWRELMAMPDINEEQELRNAPREYIREVVYNILFKGEYMPPESTDDLSFAMQYALQQYGRAKLEDFPDDRIDLLQQYISAVENIIKSAQVQAQAEQQAQQAPRPQSPAGPVPLEAQMAQQEAGIPL